MGTSADPGERHSIAPAQSWLELFYDLVFVAAIVTGVTTAFSFVAREQEAELVATGAALTAVALGALWLIGRDPVD